METLVLSGRLPKSEVGRMIFRHGDKESNAEVATSDPDNLDRQPITGRKFHRRTFSDHDSDAAVNMEPAKREVHDDGPSAEPVTAQNSSDVNLLPCDLASIRDGFAHFSPELEQRKSRATP